MVLFELVRAKYQPAQERLDKKVGTPNFIDQDYASCCEQLNFQMINEINSIMNAARAKNPNDPWLQGMDAYNKPEWSTEGKYIRYSKKTGHWDENIKVFNDILKEKGKKP